MERYLPIGVAHTDFRVEFAPSCERYETFEIWHSGSNRQRLPIRSFEIYDKSVSFISELRHCQCWACLAGVNLLPYRANFLQPLNRRTDTISCGGPCFHWVARTGRYPSLSLIGIQGTFAGGSGPRFTRSICLNSDIIHLNSSRPVSLTLCLRASSTWASNAPDISG